MLEAGELRSNIARELGVSPSTITRWARIMGFPDKGRRPSPTDWAAVQDFYDLGHSIDECREQFAFTYGSWDKAVCRGEVVPRTRANGELSRSTREDVEDLVARGLTQAEVARELGLAKSTVAFHMRQLGFRADPRFARRHDWPAVQRAIDGGLSRKECFERFGINADSWYRAVRRGAIVPNEWITPINELLVAGRARSRGHLKNRILSSGLKEDRCERCGITHWEGERLAMQLHHVNGDGNDNRLENLKLLCANCHSLTDTYGGRNGHRRKKAA